ncbi:MAG: porin [Betaproteobacteria bacterium]|nr:porin [Betaproteobacteria bacterium]
MQKKVIALAIAGLFSGAAFAQSPLAPVPSGPTSVGLYGIIDVGVVMDNAGFGNKTVVTSGGGAGSRIGLRANEDLGNGLSAILLLESGIQLDTGVVGGTAQAPGVNRAQVGSAFGGTFTNSAATGSQLISRQAFAGLSSKTMGGLMFGRQYSPMVATYAAIDTAGLAHGNTMFATFAYLPGYTTRQNNVASYMSPKFFDGVTVEVVLGSGNENNVQGDDLTLGSSDKGGRLSGLDVNYNKGPLNLSAAYQELNANTAITAAQTQVIKNRGWVVGGNYNFGMFTLYAGYGQGKERNRAGTGLVYPTPAVAPAVNAPLLIPQEANAWHIGVNVPAGTGNLMVAYSKLRDKTANVTGADFQTFGVAYRYPLSKRTRLNFGYTKGTNDQNAARILIGGGDTSAMVMGPAGTPPGGAATVVPGAASKAGFDPSRWDFGITHSF